MGITKQYLRYEAGEVFGVVAGNKANVVILNGFGGCGRFCATGACENVIVWDIRIGEMYLTLKGEKHEVTRIASSPDKQHLAVGYADGKMCVFNLKSGERTITFSGHKSAVTALNYDDKGLRLVSGGMDTDVIVWDIVNECGQYRMKGHKGAITQVAFLKAKNVLITSSKDTYVKFWDLDTQHCFKTIVEHRSEVYDFVLLRQDHRLVTGSGDSELRVWDLIYPGDSQDVEEVEPAAKKSRYDDTGEDKDDDDDELNIVHCKKIGSLMRNRRDRLVSMATDSHQAALICHGNDKTLEVFKLPNANELKKRLSKRQKKEKKKQADKQTSGETVEDTSGSVELMLSDEIHRVTSLTMPSKMACVDMINAEKSTVKVVCLFNNNTFGYCTVDIDDTKATLTDMRLINQFGHQSDVRSISLSSDNTALLSASAESVKIWNRSSLQCIRTMVCDYTLCSLFAPGDRHIILGTKSGKLQIFDIGSGSLLDNMEAHSGAVWSICMTPDKRGIISGSADKQVKFWNFELVDDDNNPASSKQLTLQLVRTLQMDEDVLCVRCSPDHRLLAVSLLDSTVKVFFMDTLKFFLSLYGHKLPVLCMDISRDSTLLVSGSADRNIKIWGLDFGDCHKSIFAHDDSIMCVQFIANTHLFFTGGKDKKIKQWDADHFEHIITLDGHHAEVWCLCVSSTGNVLATGSHDKSLRLWQKTHEPLILQEEREMEREAEFEGAIAEGGETVVPGEMNTEAGLAGRKSVETVKAAESIMEAIELYKEEKYKWSIHKLECHQNRTEKPEPEPNQLMVAFNVNTPEKYVLTILKKIKSSELEQALLVLPFRYVIDMIKLLDYFITNGLDIILSCRCLFFLLRVHHGQVTLCKELLPVIDKLRKLTMEKVAAMRDRIGFNVAGLEFLQRDLEQSGDAIFFMDATQKFKEKKKKRKKKAVLTIKT